MPEEEIDGSVWLFAMAGEYQYPQPEDSYLELSYDLSSACHECSSGKKQRSPFALKHDFKQKRLSFFGLHWVFDAVFCRPETFRALQEAFGSNIKSIPVLRHPKGVEFEDLVQLDIPVLSQEFVIDSDMKTETCAACQRTKRIRKERGMISCRPLVLHEPPPLFLTREWFGSGASSYRRIVVSNEIHDVYTQEEAKGVVIRTSIDLIANRSFPDRYVARERLEKSLTS